MDYYSLTPDYVTIKECNCPASTKPFIKKNHNTNCGEIWYLHESLKDAKKNLREWKEKLSNAEKERDYYSKCSKKAYETALSPNCPSAEFGMLWSGDVRRAIERCFEAEHMVRIHLKYVLGIEQRLRQEG